MATHDYVIDNQSAPAFRSDLNNALLAIVSQNSASTAPTTTYANMFWYDTANNQLKKRNEANSAWITLGTIDEGTGTFTPSGERALASQAQAEAGSDNTTVMTPLRTAQAIDAQVVIPPSQSFTLLGTLTTTSGSTQTLSGLTLTSYSQLVCVFNGVGLNAVDPNIYIGTTNAGIIATLGGNNDVGRGFLWIDLATGLFSASISATDTANPATAVPSPRAGICATTTASTSITFSRSAGNFDAGSIRIYGVK
jgi:hypothetical protein